MEKKQRKENQERKNQGHKIHRKKSKLSETYYNLDFTSYKFS